jgi:hypothetical protein
VKPPFALFPEASMPWTGQTNTQTGLYRSEDCGYEIKLAEGEVFPECPIHRRPVTWSFVRPLRRHER